MGRTTREGWRMGHDVEFENMIGRVNEEERKIGGDELFA